MPQSFVRRSSAEAAMRPIGIVEVLPLLQLRGEQRALVDDYTVEHPVELFGVDAVVSGKLRVRTPVSRRLVR